MGKVFVETAEDIDSSVLEDMAITVVILAIIIAVVTTIYEQVRID